jgi:hypothetical protein
MNHQAKPEKSITIEVNSKPFVVHSDRGSPIAPATGNRLALSLHLGKKARIFEGVDQRVAAAVKDLAKLREIKSGIDGAREALSWDQ